MADVKQVDFVNIDLVLDANTLGDNAIEGLRGTWEDWEPNDGDLEVVVIEEVSPMAAAVAFMATNMPKEALRGLGTKILGLTYDGGAPANTEVTFTLVDNAGYTIPAGSQLNIDGFAFAPLVDVEVPAGADTVAHVVVYCAVDAVDANGLTGDVVYSLTLPSFVTDIAVERATADGADPMDDDAFLVLVVEEMLLRARTLITERDFAIDALRVAGIGRAGATESAARVVTVTVTGTDGLAADAPTKAAVAARWTSARSPAINVDYQVVDYNYCQVNVDWHVQGVPAVDAASITSAVNAVLNGLLGPLTWPGGGTVPKNMLLAKIGVAAGVDYPIDLTLSSPTGGAVVEANGDLTMPGAHPLPQVGVLTPLVTYA